MRWAAGARPLQDRGNSQKGWGSRGLHFNRSAATPSAVTHQSPTRHLIRVEDSFKTGVPGQSRKGSAHLPDGTGFRGDPMGVPGSHRGTCEEVDRLLRASPRSGATASPKALRGTRCKGLRSRLSEVSNDSEWQRTPGTPGTPWVPPRMLQHASKNRGHQGSRGPQGKHHGKGRRPRSR